LSQFTNNLIVFYINLVLLLLRKLKQQSKEQLEERRPKLIQALKQMGDFYLQLKWDFQSWGMFKFKKKIELKIK